VHRERGRRIRAGLVAVLAASVLAGCSTAEPVTGPAVPELTGPGDPTTVLAPERAVPLAAATSAALFRTAPVVVLAADGDADGQAGAASAAVGLGAPLLLAPTAETDAMDTPAVADEVRRLAPEALLAVGGGAQEWAARALLPQDGELRTVPAAPAALAGVVGVAQGSARAVEPTDLTGAVAGLNRERAELLSTAAPADPAAAPADGAPELPATAPALTVSDLVVLARTDQQQAAAVATARAAGAPVLVLRTPDPRSNAEVVTDLAAAPQRRVLALGSGFGSLEQLQQRLAVARTGVQLPGGGQLAFPGRRMISLYGNPTTPLLGALGEQNVDASIARAKELAARYQPYSDVPVVPTFEIITTVASGAAGVDGDYSNESELALLRPYVDAARTAGVYIVLDLQPGTTDFLTQAKRYEELLAEPHVGLALDPEWRLKPGQRHMAQIGSVGVDEINQVGDWLAGLARERALPQKLLLLHQFRTSMITERERLDTAHDELAVLVHADGFGTQGMKTDTWNALRQSAPNVFWGWKNFIDEDRPMLEPEQTMQVSSDIVFVSYQ
jgi:hypothetical protein